MKKSRLQELLTFRNIAILGLLICVGVTAHQLAIGRCSNFLIFQLSTFDFWNGVSPYTEQWFEHGYDYYLYSPVFNVLFTPFAYLPTVVGTHLWNVFNYLVILYAIYSFPKITAQQKAHILLFLLPVLATSFMSTQYNVAVAAMFVLGFSLMERGRPIAAIIVMLISGTTKIYGLAELAILVFYPRVWRNVGYAVIFGGVLAALPLVRYGFVQYVDLLREWTGVFAAHKASRVWETIYDVAIIPWNGMRYVLMPYIQVGVFAVLSVFVLMRRKLWDQFGFRIGVVALIMGWCILFGNSSETHTYLISVAGFLLWYRSVARRTDVMRVLYWAVFVVICLMPIDLIFPSSVWHFFYRTLDLNKYLMLAVWLYMSYQILSASSYLVEDEKEETRRQNFNTDSL